MKTIDLNFNPPKPPKCKHCGFLKMEHKAVNYACPIDRKTRIGHTQYSNTQTFEPKTKASAPKPNLDHLV